MSNEISDSRFYMWRTLFAVVHADGVATQEEVRFMAEALEDIPFNEQQRGILKQDIYDPQDITKMFEGVTDVTDQAEFFKLAHELVHVDGDYGSEEQEVMLQLQKAHLQKVSIDELVGKVDLCFEGEEDEPVPQQEAPCKTSVFQNIVAKLKRGF